MTKIGLWLSIPEPLIVEAAARPAPTGSASTSSTAPGTSAPRFAASSSSMRSERRRWCASPSRSWSSSRACSTTARRRGAGHGLERGAGRGGGAARALPARGRAQLRRSALRDAAGARRRLRDPAACLSDDRGPARRQGRRRDCGSQGYFRAAHRPGGPRPGLGLDRDDPRFADALQSIVASGHAVGLPVTMHAVGRTKAADGWTWASMSSCSRPTSSCSGRHLRPKSHSFGARAPTDAAPASSDFLQIREAWARFDRCKPHSGGSPTGRS